MKFYVSTVFLTLILFSSCQKENVSSTTQNETTAPAGNSVFNVDAGLMLQLVNNIRQSGCNCGATVMPPVSAVSWNDLLARAALDHSRDMENKNYFDHNSPQGIDPGTRITTAGYTWRTYGENIAKGYTSEKDVVNGWLNSEGHCKNMMNPNFKEMGVGRSGNYWTQEFATKLNP